MAQAEVHCSSIFIMSHQRILLNVLLSQICVKYVYCLWCFETAFHASLSQRSIFFPWLNVSAYSLSHCRGKNIVYVSLSLSPIFVVSSKYHYNHLCYPFIASREFQVIWFMRLNMFEMSHLYVWSVSTNPLLGALSPSYMCIVFGVVLV